MTIEDIDTHRTKHVTLPELAAYIGVTTRSLYHQIDKGALIAVRIGGVIRVKTTEARRYCSVPARVA